MRIFVAGATGVIGMRLIPLLVSAGHDVAGMTRSPSKVSTVQALGADPVLCDVFDASVLTDAVTGYGPDTIIDQLTDLPDTLSELGSYRDRNDRMRTEGTRNLLAAASDARVPLVIAQSIAWEHPNEHARAAVAEHEQMILEYPGVVVRYGQLFGPGTYYPSERPPPPRIHIDDAARRTLVALHAAPGTVMVVDEDQA